MFNLGRTFILSLTLYRISIWDVLVMLPNLNKKDDNCNKSGATDSRNLVFVPLISQ